MQTLNDGQSERPGELSQQLIPFFLVFEKTIESGTLVVVIAVEGRTGRTGEETVLMIVHSAA